MRIKKEYKVRSIAGENMVICQGKALSDMTKVVYLNDSAVKLWKALEGKEFTPEDAALTLQNLYGIEADCAQQDAAKWMDNLQKADIIAE